MVYQTIKLAISFLLNIFKKKEKKNDDQYIPSQLEMIKFFYKNLNLNWKVITALNLMNIVSSFIYVRNSFILLQIKDSLTENRFNEVWSYVIEYIGYTLFQSIQSYLQGIVHIKYAKSITSSVQKSLLEHLFSLDIHYFEENKVTQLTELIQNGTSEINNQIQYSSFMSQINYQLYVIGQIYFAYCISPRITISILICTTIFGAISQFIKRKMDKQDKDLDIQHQYKAFALDDIMNNILIIKSFGQEKKEIDALTKITKNNSTIQEKRSGYQTIYNSLYEIRYDVTAIVIILQIFLMSSSSEHHRIISQSLPEFLTLSIYLTQIYSVVVSLILQESNSYYDECSARIGKVMKLLEQKPSIPQQINDSTKQKHLKGNISFENVSFKYPLINDKLAKMNQQIHKIETSQQDAAITEPQINSKQNLSESSSNNELEVEIQTNEEEKLIKERTYAVENVSFQIKQGQFVSFVGKSGSGKSTIAKLLQRVYDPNIGNVVYDGQNIKDLPIRQIKQSIGYVSQEPTLLDNDIEYNITYGCQDGDYTDEDLKKVCDVSGVSEFAFDQKRFPQGLKTLIGTNGIKLSGGQKQRVAIARALLKNPSILILDEATSSLDAESEHIVQKYIDEIVENENRQITIIVIAHRLSTILKSDTIFMMEQGQIKEVGNHKQLVKQEGVYKQLINRQMQAQTPQS